jgi:hypothetical protein
MTPPVRDAKGTLPGRARSDGRLEINRGTHGRRAIAGGMRVLVVAFASIDTQNAVSNVGIPAGYERDVQLVGTLRRHRRQMSAPSGP